MISASHAKRTVIEGECKLELILFCGLQGAGKTTFYQKNFSSTHLRLSLEILRNRRREREILNACLSVGQRAVIDNTNTTRQERAHYVGPARDAHFRVLLYRFDAPFDICVSRNSQRLGKAKVPVAGIRAMAARMEPPSLDEGFAAIYAVTPDGVATLEGEGQ